MSQPIRSCSFCHQPESKVKHLICGEDGIAICNYCIVLCYGVLQKMSIDVTPGTPVEPRGSEK